MSFTGNLSDVKIIFVLNLHLSVIAEQYIHIIYTYIYFISTL